MTVRDPHEPVVPGNENFEQREASHHTMPLGSNGPLRDPHEPVLAVQPNDSILDAPLNSAASTFRELHDHIHVLYDGLSTSHARIDKLEAIVMELADRVRDLTEKPADVVTPPQPNA